MSDFITTENKSISENYQINTTKVKLIEPRSIKVASQLPELIKVARPIVVSQRDGISWREVNDGGIRRARRSVDGGISSGGLLRYIHEDFDVINSAKSICLETNDTNFKAPFRNIRTVNMCQTFSEQNRDSIGNNTTKLYSNSTVTQEKFNIPSNTTTYCTNGTQMNKVKTANSSGSSFIMQTPPPAFTAVSQSLNQIEKNDLRNQFKYIKSQNVAFSVKNNDLILFKNGDEGMKTAPTPKIINRLNDGKLIDFNNVSFKNNSKVPLSSVLGRKDSIPEFCEPEICEISNGTPMCSPDIMDDKVSTFHSLEESLLPTDYVYANNCYLPAVNLNEARNSISYMNNPMSVVVLNKAVVPKNVNLNSYSQYCLTQLQPYANDNITITNPISNDQNIQNVQNFPNTECSEYILLRRESVESTPIYNPNLVIETPQKPSMIPLNNCIKNANNYSVVASDMTDCKNAAIESLVKRSDVSGISHDTMDFVPYDSNHDVDVKMVGKFTVKTTRDKDHLSSSLNVPNDIVEDTCNTSISFVKDISSEDLNKNTNSDNQQPRSRFKKTRIRETIERWHINGFNTYDCRIKVIPTKIMELHDNAIDHMGNDSMPQLCKNCGDHDNGFRCYLNEYNNKEFRFWDNGDRIAICGKSEFETDIYCQFHAKYLKLLNQNQNMSLSKFVPQSFNCPNSTISSSPQIIRAVLISTPDNDNYTTNIDINVSQNVALSAPPVSPSQLNSVPSSCLPHNLHSPQSSAAMVMLRCHTPVIWSNASRNASLMSESISIEKINYKPSSRMSLDSESGTMSGQPILLTDGNSLMEMFQNSPMQHDHSQCPMPASSCFVDSGFLGEVRSEETVYDDQQAIYSMGHIPRILYSIPQQVIPSITTSINNKRKQDNFANFSNLEEYTLSSPLSSTLIHEIDDNLNSLKSMIRKLVQTEQQTLINEIKSLSHVNEKLHKELLAVKKRSEYLESILRNNNVSVDTYSGEFDTSEVDHSPLVDEYQCPEPEAFDS